MSIKSASPRSASRRRDVAAAKKAHAGLDAVADGIFLARDLVNEPPNILYPAEFARRAKALSKLGLKVEMLGEAEMKKQGFGALLGRRPGHRRAKASWW